MQEVFVKNDDLKIKLTFKYGDDGKVFLLVTSFLGSEHFNSKIKPFLEAAYVGDRMSDRGKIPYELSIQKNSVKISGDLVDALDMLTFRKFIKKDALYEVMKINKGLFSQIGYNVESGSDQSNVLVNKKSLPQKMFKKQQQLDFDPSLPNPQELGKRLSELADDQKTRYLTTLYKYAQGVLSQKIKFNEQS
jgi:hypothetical protein